MPYGRQIKLYKMTKVYTTKGRKIKRTLSTYERIVNLHIALGEDFKSAQNKWKMFNIESSMKSLAY